MKRILFLILPILCTSAAFAQETVSSAGGNATGGGGSVSYTVGQVANTTNTGSNGSVAHGVQQAFEISVLTTVEEAENIFLEWTAYPNPASDFLKLSMKNPESSGLSIDNLSYRLYDSNGKLLLNENLDGFETTVTMVGLQSGIYILKVTESLGKASKKELKTFKIIKH